jgi:hypothetical protein
MTSIISKLLDKILDTHASLFSFPKCLLVIISYKIKIPWGEAYAMDDQLIYYSYQFNSFFLTKIAGDW